MNLANYGIFLIWDSALVQCISGVIPKKIKTEVKRVSGARILPSSECSAIHEEIEFLKR